MLNLSQPPASFWPELLMKAQAEAKQQLSDCHKFIILVILFIH